MTTETAIVPNEVEARRKLALLKAVGLDRVAPEQRELALAIARRYDLDLMLKHLVLIEGRPYITRDGLLWVAHRSGALDGIEVTDPEVVNLPGAGEFWRAKASVYRKDMTRPFTYAGRYPTKGGNQRYAPEMAVKVAEVMALRRAFNVSAPVLEERWDIEVPVSEERPATPTLHERAAQHRAQLDAAEPDAGAPEPPPPTDEPPLPPEPVASAACDSRSPHGDGAPCVREGGHQGSHRSADRESWS